ncbi:MAG: protein kinase, partial [Myxococcales bacterium]|nr:protein kinase [Myxococcales bacterium]
RFFNEARAANAVQHPGIVRIFDCGVTDSGVAYLSMEFLEGESLRARLGREHQLPVKIALRIARQIASALTAAHRVGIVHRDLLRCGK